MRFFLLLGILEKLSKAIDNTGARTKEGHRIYQQYFTGDKVLFFDSSDTEKRTFRRELTFHVHGHQGNPIFCPWNGEASTGTFRLHFKWPTRSGEPIYVVYAGPKIAKR